MCEANACILPRKKVAFKSGEISRYLVLFLLSLYLSLSVLTDAFHNHPIGSQGNTAQSCTACSWIQTSRTNLTIVPSLPGPTQTSLPLLSLHQILCSQSFAEIPRLRSPPMLSHEN